MNISAMDSASAGRLFSSLNTGNSFTNMSFVSDYNSIRSGSYGKLLSAYYKEAASGSVSSKGSATTGTDHTSRAYREAYLKAQEEKKKAQSASGQMSYLDKVQSAKAKDNNAVSKASDRTIESLDALRNKDLYKTDSAGAYNTDKIYSAAKSYVDSYNSLLDSAKDTKVSGVSSNITGIKNTTDSYMKSLSAVGISVGSDGKLSINEEAFKKSDMASVQKLFDKGSYGYSARTNAYMSGYYAKQANNSVTSYGASGAYSMSDIMSSYQSYI